jgi:paraquat-inducible protein B
MRLRANPKLIGATVLGGLAMLLAVALLVGGLELFRETRPYILYFEESVRGLDTGAPVTFQGVPVGSVRSVKVEVASHKMDLRIPVVIEIERGRFSEAPELREEGQEGWLEALDEGEVTLLIQELIDRGLRAQLVPQSFITGKQEVQLAFHPETPARLLGASEEYVEIPTILAPTARLTRTLQDLPLVEIANETLATVKRIRTIVTSPQVSRSLEAVESSLQSVASLLGDPAVKGTVRSTQRTVREFGQLARDLKSTTRELTKSGMKVTKAADAALEQATRSLTKSQNLLDEDSPTLHQVRTAFRELEQAARSLNQLADFLQRNPEAALFGKRPAGE